MRFTPLSPERLLLGPLIAEHLVAFLICCLVKGADVGSIFLIGSTGLPILALAMAGHPYNSNGYFAGEKATHFPLPQRRALSHYNWLTAKITHMNLQAYKHAYDTEVVNGYHRWDLRSHNAPKKL